MAGCNDGTDLCSVHMGIQLIDLDDVCKFQKEREKEWQTQTGARMRELRYRMKVDRYWHYSVNRFTVSWYLYNIRIIFNMEKLFPFCLTLLVQKKRKKIHV